VSSAQTLTQVLGIPVTSRNLDSPVFVTSWPGNSNVLLVAERGSSRITGWSFEDSGTIKTFTLVDLFDYQAFVPLNFTEFLGVTGFAFHPEFLTDPNKRFLYVRYNASDRQAATTFVDRWTIPPGSQSVTASSNTAIYTWPTTALGHGSGTIQFDTRSTGTNLLYVPMPDDTSTSVQSPDGCCDAARAQDDAGPSDIGHLLTIDVDAVPPLVVPVAKGLRNPFGFSVDRGDASTGVGLGDVWIGDVGRDRTGSILRRGPLDAIDNFGWPWQEGVANTLWTATPMLQQTTCGMSAPSTAPNSVTCGEPGGVSYTLPYTVFSDQALPGPHDALIGGYVYRASTVPSNTDQYVFAIYGNGRQPRIYRLPAVGGGMANAFDLSPTLGLTSWLVDHTIHGLGQDTDGELYVIRVDESGGQTGNGVIFKVTP